MDIVIDESNHFLLLYLLYLILLTLNNIKKDFQFYYAMYQSYLIFHVEKCPNV